MCTTMAKKKRTEHSPKKKRDARAAKDGGPDPAPSTRRAGRLDGATAGRKSGSSKAPRSTGKSQKALRAADRTANAAERVPTAPTPKPPTPKPSTPKPPAPVSTPAPVALPQSPGDLEGLLAMLASVDDPERRYELATVALGEHLRAMEQLSVVRGDAVASAYRAGGSIRELAQRLGVSPSRVHQLIQDAQARSDGVGRSTASSGTDRV